MAKNDFDIDFDFEKEYGFDPKAILDSEYTISSMRVERICTSTHTPSGPITVQWSAS